MVSYSAGHKSHGISGLDRTVLTYGTQRAQRSELTKGIFRRPEVNSMEDNDYDYSDRQQTPAEKTQQQFEKLNV